MSIILRITINYVELFFIFEKDFNHLNIISSQFFYNVLFRICVLLGLMFTFFIRATIIFVISNLSGYLSWWSSQVNSKTYCEESIVNESSAL
jgi:hypothetical protein